MPKDYKRPVTTLFATSPGRSLIVIRSESGAINAFHNVCSHRAARLLKRYWLQAAIFPALYHAWTYDAEGALIRAPNAANGSGI